MMGPFELSKIMNAMTIMRGMARITPIKAADTLTARRAVSRGLCESVACRGSFVPGALPERFPNLAEVTRLRSLRVNWSAIAISGRLASERQAELQTACAKPGPRLGCQVLVFKGVMALLRC
jgi:hypothetical protein